jgi:hypothetical protein
MKTQPPETGEIWITRSVARRIVRVVRNPRRLTNWVLLVQTETVGQENQETTSEWITGKAWAIWKATRKAVLRDNPRTVVCPDTGLGQRDHEQPGLAATPSHDAASDPSD